MKKLSVKLLIQSPRIVFCYYNISPETQEEFQNAYGNNAWENSKPIIKVYKINDGVSDEIKTININKNEESYYINLLEDNIEVYVKFGRILASGKFIELAESNIISTPRERTADNESLYFMDTSNINGEDIIIPSSFTNNKNQSDLIFKKDIHKTDYFDEYYRNIFKVYENTSSR
ncbi:DUF4912 domain-containing protein [Clostridium sediminicola]|uniref:DUF4912 domain-containing protein n=1 Tax=Clostridium sediminicola TaxID=3114879 RepID=UPI0031F27DB7